MYLSYCHVEVFAAFPACMLTSRACEHVMTPIHLHVHCPICTGMTTNQSYHTNMVVSASLRYLLPVPPRSAFGSRSVPVASLLSRLPIRDVIPPQIGRQVRLHLQVSDSPSTFSTFTTRWNRVHVVYRPYCITFAPQFHQTTKI